MLPKIVLPPRPKFKTLEDAQKWADSWNEFFLRTYEEIRKQFDEMDKVSVRGTDGLEIHGFFSQKSDINI